VSDEKSCAKFMVAAEESWHAELARRVYSTPKEAYQLRHPGEAQNGKRSLLYAPLLLHKEIG
jgi:hypothetical protein